MKSLKVRGKNALHKHFYSFIIPNFGYKSNVIFIAKGLSEVNIFQRLNISFLIYDDILALECLPKETKESLKDSELIYLGAKFSDFKEFKKFYSIFVSDEVKGLYFMDYETLKAYELIPPKEFKQNDYFVSLEFKGANLEEYTKEIIKEQRTDKKELHSYLTNLLKFASDELIKRAKKEFKANK